MQEGLIPSHPHHQHHHYATQGSVAARLHIGGKEELCICRVYVHYIYTRCIYTKEELCICRLSSIHHHSGIQSLSQMLPCSTASAPCEILA